MKKVILSMVFMFAVTTFVNATVLAERDCVAEAMAAGDRAEENGASYELAYFYASYAYTRCEYDLPN